MDRPGAADGRAAARLSCIWRSFGRSVSQIGLGERRKKKKPTAEATGVAGTRLRLRDHVRLLAIGLLVARRVAGDLTPRACRFISSACMLKQDCAAAAPVRAKASPTAHMTRRPANERTRSPNLALSSRIGAGRETMNINPRRDLGVGMASSEGSARKTIAFASADSHLSADFLAETAHAHRPCRPSCPLPPRPVPRHAGRGGRAGPHLQEVDDVQAPHARRQDRHLRHRRSRWSKASPVTSPCRRRAGSRALSAWRRRFPTFRSPAGRSGRSSFRENSRRATSSSASAARSSSRRCRSCAAATRSATCSSTSSIPTS